MRRLIALAVAATILAGTAGPAAAQLRSIPLDATRATMRHLQESIVLINGKQLRLSPGAQIRDANNRIVLPVALTQETVVRYLPDATGAVHRVWILSAAEVARRDPPPPEK